MILNTVYYLFLNYFYYFVSFIFCFYLLILQIKKIKFNHFNVIFLLLIILINHSLILSYFQFIAFKNHPISQFLLPPYQSIFWFLGYIFNHYFKVSFFRIIGGIINIFIVYIINNLFKNSLFYKEEYKKVFLVSLMIDFPLNLLLIPVAFLYVLLLHFLYIFKYKSFNKDQKISTKFFWLPLAFLFIIINIYFIKNLDSFKFLYKFIP